MSVLSPSCMASSWISAVCISPDHHSYCPAAFQPHNNLQALGLSNTAASAENGFWEVDVVWGWTLAEMSKGTKREGIWCSKTSAVGL